MCHGNDLAGGGAAPALAGPNFVNQWRTQSVDALVQATRASMPPNNPGGLSEQTYLNITAFILQANGAEFGNQPLISAVTDEIGALATGIAPAGLFDNAGPVQTDAPQGVTVAGTVENYVPVTAEMKINPDPADWLMIRGNY
jgi:alcohol dehydrogenase (cytochrome c)